jgi:hypothetical protein
MTSPFELEVSGRLPRALMQVISTRFGNIALMEQHKRTVLYGGVADQAALRALLCLIWDSGGSLVSVAVHDADEDRGTDVDPPSRRPRRRR